MEHKHTAHHDAAATTGSVGNANTSRCATQANAMDRNSRPIYSCSNNGCTYVAPSAWMVVRHARGHGVQVHRCPDCTFVGSSAYALRVHSFEHGACPYACGECGKRYTSSKTLESHQRIHSGALGTRTRICSPSPRMWSYVCPFEGCGRVCECPAKLAAHQQTHEGAKGVLGIPCPVDGCAHRAASRHNLKVHELRHACERNFVCPAPACAFAAVTKSDLARHSKRHARDNRPVEA